MTDTVDLSQLSTKALAQIMNAINPDGGGWEVDADHQVFSKVSAIIAQRFENRCQQCGHY